jgi:hypothetical protein
LKLQVKHYENLGIAVTPYLCAGSSGMQIHAVDPTGQEWSWDDLRVADSTAFQTQYHRLGADLRKSIVDNGETTPVQADVWFAMPLEDEQDKPSKEALLAMSNADRKAAIAAHNASIAARGTEVAAAIQKLSASIRIAKASAAFIGGGPLLQVTATAPLLRAIGDLGSVSFVGLTQLRSVPLSEDWYDVDDLATAEGFLTGSGVKVADLEDIGVYDSTYLALASGTCPAGNGQSPSYLCEDPSNVNHEAPGNDIDPCGAGHAQAVLYRDARSHPALRE